MKRIVVLLFTLLFLTVSCFVCAGAQYFEIYRPTNEIEVNQYDVVYDVRAQGGYVESVKGYVVVKTIEGGEFGITCKLTEQPKHLEELKDAGWYYCCDIEGIEENYTVKSYMLNKGFVLDGRLGAHYNPGEDFTDGFIQIMFAPKVKPTDTNYVTIGGNRIPIYEKKTYKCLETENKLMAEQLDTIEKTITDLRKENMELEAQLSGKFDPCDVNRDGVVDIKDWAEVIRAVGRAAVE